VKRRQSVAAAALFFLSFTAVAQEQPTAKGEVIEKVTCAESPGQSYALYLPTSYSAEKPSPILYVFDPAARGRVAVEAIRTAAEEYGYIVAASNNSRNGLLGGSGEAANAVFHDTHQRFSIDDRRLYAAGFSGGARLATQIARNCKTCIAGVIANGAGFPTSGGPTKDLGFSYYLAIGEGDFNYPEMVDLRRQLEQLHANYRIQVFDGGHEWAPPEVWEDALRWMRLQAMRSGNAAVDAKQIRQILQQESEEARALESKGNILEAERNYESILRDFDGLAETSDLKAHAEELKSGKGFKAAEKQEREDVDRQARLSAKASSEMQEIVGSNVDLAEYSEIQRTIAELKDDVSKARNPKDPNVLVKKRALGGLVVQAYEAGEHCMETKNYVAALAYFDLVAAGAKSPGGARYERARVYAAQGDAKKCLAELKQAQANGFHDPAALEAAEFKPYRQLPEFQSLASEWNKQAQP